MWLIVWFYMAWGISYFRVEFHERFGTTPAEVDCRGFEAVVIQFIDSLNNAYTVKQPQFDIAVVDREIETLYARNHKDLQLPWPCGWRRVKKTVLQPLMTRMGVLGYFDPFFNEVQVNDHALPLSLPYTIAHEKAHQLGIASEAECNLYATVICIASQHPQVRYSGYLQTVRYLLNSLRTISPERYREIAGKLDSRIHADYRTMQEHWEKNINPALSNMQEKVYDAYLKSNRQQSGVTSYSEMTGLLMTWEKLGKKMR
jgi:hypothetical protein